MKKEIDKKYFYLNFSWHGIESLGCNLSVTGCHWVNFEVLEPILYEKKGIDFTLELVWITVRICVYPIHTHKLLRDYDKKMFHKATL